MLAVQMVLLLGGSIPAMRSMAAAGVVYTNDFQGAIGAEWSNTATDVTPAAARKFLGQFSNQTVSLTLNSLPAHAEVTLEFDLFVIRSWDGSTLGAGPDVFDVSVAGGSALLHTTFNTHVGGTQAYPDTYPGGSHPSNTGAVETYTLGYLDVGSPSDAVYHLSFTLPHTASSVVFNFTVSGLEPISNESWGLDNVVVSLPNTCGNGISESPEQCDEGPANGLSGSCCNADCTWKSAGTVCRAAAGECDVAETCTGSSGTCAADSFAAANTPCTADGNPCTDDVCNGSGSCTHPNNTAPCSDGLFCNGPDTCSGGSCSVHAGNPCTGGAECNDVCNEAADNCAVTAGTPCTDDGNVCTVDQCSGSGTCAHPAGHAGTVCRAAAGDCDVAENCTGSAAACPADTFKPSSTVCRPAAGQCDLAESCTGSSATCPADEKSTAVCRAAAGQCDIAETCDGRTNTCPTDALRNDGEPCDTHLDTCSESDSCKGGVCINTGGGGDPDHDGVCSLIDVCPNAADPPQADTDGDGVGDACDNCPQMFNAAQSDADGDSIGDLCDSEPPPASFTLTKVRLKSNVPPVANRGAITLQGTFDATELGGDLSSLQSAGAAVEVSGAGLSAPEIMRFPGPRCVQLGTRFKCTGTLGEVLSVRHKPGSLFALKLQGGHRSFSAPLSTAAVSVTLSLGSVDRRDGIASCTYNGRGVATCKK